MIPRHDSLFQRWSVNHALPYRTVAFIVDLLRGQALHASSHVCWWFTCKNSFDTGRKLFFANPIEGYEILIGRIWLGQQALAQTWPFCGGAPFTHVRPQRPSVRSFEVLPCGHVCSIRQWSGLRWCGRWRWRWPGASPPHLYCTTLVPIVLPLLPHACYCRKRQPYCNKKMMATDCKVHIRKLFWLPIREKLS